MPKIKVEEVDYIFVQDISFSVVMKDGSDALISDKGILFDAYSKEQLSDNVRAHLEQNLPIEILDDIHNTITFEPEFDALNLRETD
jgi:hypothetical protein